MRNKDKEYILQYFNVRDGEQEYDRRFMYDKANHIKLNEIGLLKNFFGKHIYQDGTLDKEEWWIDGSNGERCCSVGMSYSLNQKEKNFLERKGV